MKNTLRIKSNGDLNIIGEVARKDMPGVEVFVKKSIKREELV